MKRFLIFPQWKRFFFCMMLFPAAMSIHGQGFSSVTESQLQQVLASFTSNPNFVGGLTAAIKIDGLASWEGASGYAARNVDGQNNLLPGGSPFATSTLSRAYSITKTFTAALTLELAREGLINLDHSIGMYFPMAQINPGLDPSVTLRQLLAHESGYSDYTGEFQFQLALAFQPTHTWTPFEVAYFVHQVAPPGTERRYSSTNYILLGALIEALTGTPVEQQFRQRFFSPLGLNSMYFGVREPQPPGTQLAAPHDDVSPFNPIFQLTGQPIFPSGYTNIFRFPFEGIVSAAFTGGAIVSNAKDLAEWGEALFTGKATSRSTLNAMLQSISPTPDAQGDYLGYGIWRSTKMSATEVFLGHDGNAPGYRSVLFYQPDKRITIAVMTNFGGAPIYDVAKALYAALPDMFCGNENKKEDKIRICKNGVSLCVARKAAGELVQHGAVLGNCGGTVQKPVAEAEKMEALTTYPNPFRDHVNISFRAMETGNISLTVVNAQGQVVAIRNYGTIVKGTSRLLQVNTAQLPAGNYVFRIKGPSLSMHKNMVLVK